MKNSAETTIETSVAVTTLNANQIAKADYFGYSSVMSKESSKVSNFLISDVSETEKQATWSIEQKGKIESYKVVFSLNTDYQHGTIGRYLQSLEVYDTNAFLHSFGNSPATSIIDIATVFNIPLHLLNSETCEQLAEAIHTFSIMRTESTLDVKAYLSTLESFGLTVDEGNTFASKIQALTSLQKNYVYFKDKTSSRTIKLEWDKEKGLDLVLSLKFDNDSDKKSYAYDLKDIVRDCSIKVSKTKDFASMTKQDKKDATFKCMQASLNKYQDKAIHVKLEIVSNKDENDFDLDSLFE